MYLIHNKGKSVVAERFIRTLKNRIFKHMTAISKNVYFDVLDDTVSKYNNSVHRTIKMKPIDVKDNAYVDSKKEVKDKDPTFKVGGHVRISKYKNIFAKGFTTNWSEEVFVIARLKIRFHEHMFLIVLMMKKLQEHFRKRNCRRLIRKNSE